MFSIVFGDFIAAIFAPIIEGIATVLAAIFVPVFEAIIALFAFLFAPVAEFFVAVFAFIVSLFVSLVSAFLSMLGLAHRARGVSRVGYVVALLALGYLIVGFVGGIGGALMPTYSTTTVILALSVAVIGAIFGLGAAVDPPEMVPDAAPVEPTDDAKHMDWLAVSVVVSALVLSLGALFYAISHTEPLPPCTVTETTLGKISDILQDKGHGRSAAVLAQDHCAD